jgi:hypothetical protein
MWLWLTVLAYVRALQFHDARWRGLAEDSLSRCTDDPQQCLGGDDMRETAGTIKKEVLAEVNATRARFIEIDSNFEECNTFTSEVSKYRSDFRAKAENHRLCREQQEPKYTVLEMCRKLLDDVKRNKSVVCESKGLTQSPADLVSLCSPTPQEELGMWLDDMAQVFHTRSLRWKADRDACQQAGLLIPLQESECSAADADYKKKEIDCDEKLNKLELFSCGWAEEYAVRCASYDKCFTSVQERRSKAVEDATESAERWRKSWLAASRMECMANAMNTSGVDEAKLHACHGENITNMSFIKIVIPPVPSRYECPAPEIFPGSNSYNTEVYGRLPTRSGNLTARRPTPCQWAGQAQRCDFAPRHILISSDRKCQKHGGLVTSTFTTSRFFELSFDLVPHGKVRGWNNILHIGNTNGERIPAVWMFSGSTRLHVRMGSTRSWNDGCDPTAWLPLHQKTRVAIRLLEDTFSVLYNGTVQCTKSFAGVHIDGRSNRYVYVSDPWYSASAVTVSNLLYAPCGSE